jgi:hypothetical protein
MKEQNQGNGKLPDDVFFHAHVRFDEGKVPEWAREHVRELHDGTYIPRSIAQDLTSNAQVESMNNEIDATGFKDNIQAMQPGVEYTVPVPKSSSGQNKGLPDPRTNHRVEKSGLR